MGIELLTLILMREVGMLLKAQASLGHVNVTTCGEADNSTNTSKDLSDRPGIIRHLVP
jgi:hypothetical protein